MERIFALGSNGSGQLGIGHRDDVSSPVECIFDDSAYQQRANDGQAAAGASRKVKRISCGGNHTLILFEDGAVYAAGLNDDLRCGVRRTTDLNSREEDGDVLTRFERVVFRIGGSAGVVIDCFKDVCATWSTSCFVATVPLDNDGNGEKDVVISLGTGDKGELGLGPRLTSTSSTKKTVVDETGDVDDHVLADFPPPDTRVEAISSGMNHVVVILSNGDVHGWGASRKGQLGSDPAIVNEKVIWAPMKLDVTGFEAVPESVSCGREFTFIGGYQENATGVDRGKYVYTILGTDDKWNIRSAAPSVQTLQDSGQTKNTYDVSTSWHGVYLHNTLEESVIAWGRNDRGQLGVHGQSNATQVPLVRWESVSRFMAGSEHAVAVLSDNKTVVSCGWGEHGNCGPDTDERGNVEGRLGQIRLPAVVLQDDKAKVIRVAAGCATSWIVLSS